jgi:hypothetical protein
VDKPKSPKKDPPKEPEKTVPLFELEDNRLVNTGLRVPGPKRPN